VTGAKVMPQIRTMTISHFYPMQSFISRPHKEVFIDSQKLSENEPYDLVLTIAIQKKE